jgi:succinyl-CoA synthetase alpha subunit
MTILLDRSTPVLVLGITGKIGSFHTQEMIAYGTNVVGGVTPGKGGSSVHNVPVFDTIKEAVERTGATAAIVFVPPPFAADSIMEAADAGLKLCVAITDGIPAKDMIRVKRYMRRYRQEHHLARQVAARHHAGPHLSARPYRRRRAFRHARL